MAQNPPTEQADDDRALAPLPRDAISGLRAPLSFAARDNFANLDRVANLGATLAAAATSAQSFFPTENGAALATWARDLAAWPTLDRTARERLVARGLRLVATLEIALPVPRGAAKQPIAHQAGATPLAQLAGVGPKTAERLAQRGLCTVVDLLHFIPRRWDDLRALTPVGALQPGVLQLTRARVLSSRMVFGRRRFFEVVMLGDDGARLTALWFFFRRGMKERFHPGATFLLSGTPRPYRGGLQMAHPETTLLEEETFSVGATAAAQTVRARYGEVEGVPARLVEKLCRTSADFAHEVIDGLPEALRVRRELPMQGEALSALHRVSDDAPPNLVEALNRSESPSHRRLAYDELFFLQLGLAERRAEMRAENAAPCPIDRATAKRFLASLPFRPTDAQTRAIADIARDLSRPHPMQRLLQGDVGSGKTVVMYAAATQTAAAKRQVAIMAPTELLAEQHARTLAPWASAAGHRLALLTASTPRGSRESIRRLLAAGELDLVVGTHALLSEGVAFSQLGLVVIDEQHRFGVEQRALLRQKGGAEVPHLLVMTATPIPRTLALTAYGDLDLTLLDEMPPGREPPTTQVLVGKRGRADAYRLLGEALEAGAQAYVVCPLVEESEVVDVADAVATHQRLSEELPRVPIGLVHGRLTAAERDDVMERFRAGAVRLLVATTVIEVGVDVPTATVMLIDGADRFGLAQLHQLRGRIGRGGGRALCLLVTDGAKTPEANRRLEVMAESGDGFFIAEADLKLRGPGELYGTRQAGMPRLRFADLARDLDLLRLARDDAFALLDEDRALARPEHQKTRAVLAERWNSGTLFGEEAG